MTPQERLALFYREVGEAIAASGMTPAQVAERDRRAEVTRLHYWHGDGSCISNEWSPHDPDEPCWLCERARRIEERRRREALPAPMALPIPRPALRSEAEQLAFNLAV